MYNSALNVVVTGSTGIAASTARKLAGRGDHVYIVSQDPDSCRDLAIRLGSNCAGWFVADLREEHETVAAFDAAAESLDKLDAVIAVAGGSARKFGDGWLHEMSLASWHAALELNLTTMFLTAREAVRRMRDSGGSLTMTSSILATSPQCDNFTTHGYAAAKASITGWTISLAAAYANDGIRINTVAPGLVRTAMALRAAEDSTIVAFAERKQPLTRGFLSADQVAEAMCWFTHCEGVTGQVLAVDGGWSVTSTS